MKKNLMKKLWSGFLCAMMAMMLLTGCGSDALAAGNAEVPEITICTYKYYDYSDMQSVEDAINEITVDKYGIKVKLMILESGNYRQQSNMLLTGDEVDVFYISNTPLLTYVKNGQLLPLTNYYNNASEEFKKATEEEGNFTEENLNCLTINGELYSLPTLRQIGSNTGLSINRAVADEYGIHPGDRWTLDDVDAFLAKVHEEYPDRYAIVPQASSLMTGNGWTWDSLGDQKMIGVIDAFGTDPTVKSVFEMDAFKEFCRHTRMWYENGYMMADCLSNSETGIQMIEAGRAVCCFNSAVDVLCEQEATDKSFKIILTDAKKETSQVSNLSWGINANSKNPDAAWKVMELIYSDPEVGKLFCMGIEGKHYALTKDGLAVPPEGKDSMSLGYSAMMEWWNYPNAGLGYSNQTPDFYDRIKEFNKSVVPGIGFGFTFNIDNVVDEYSACSSVMDKYYNPLMLGAVDPDEIIPLAIDELMAAGGDKVIAEKQAQFDAWLANK